MAEGLQRSSATGSSIVAWRAIDAVTQSGNHVFVRVGTTVWVLPFRCFASEEHRTQFVLAVAAHRSAASMPPPPPVAPPPAG